jgi:hypothetical protein
MKTKTFLLVCLFLGIGLNQLLAQAPLTGKGTVVDRFTWDGYSLPVYCSGTLVDNLEGSVSVLEIIHYGKNGEWEWATHICSGMVKSTSGSGEVFRLKELDKKYLNGAPTQDIIVIAVGNQGTVYNLTFLFDTRTYELIPVRSGCH